MLSLAVVLLVPSAAGAVLPQQSGNVDLLAQANVRLDGAAAGDEAGRWVAGAGDVNGDGIADVIVGARLASYVVFGSADTASVDLNALGAAGFRIDGATTNDQAARSVAGGR